MGIRNASKFNEDLIKNYNEKKKKKNKGYIFEADIEYSERLQNFHSDLPFLPEIMKIKKM